MDSLTPENLATLFDQSFSPTLLVDSKLIIQYFNPLWSTMLQLPPRKIKGQSLIELLPMEDKWWKDLIKDAKEKSSAVSSEITFNFNNQAFTFVFRVASVEEGKSFLIFGNDLSVERSLHDKYREQLEQLREGHEEVVQADKVKAIGELTAGISHEINNPLTVASGNMEILGFSLESEDLKGERENLSRCSENVIEALDRINVIIQGLKGFLHKEQQEKKQYIDLKEVVQNTLKLVESSYDEYGVQLKVELPEVTMVALGHKVRLEQVLINLLQNALDSVKAKGPDGLVELKLSKISGQKGLAFDVTDNGSGVDEDIRAKIFDTFFTTKAMGEGTGLGLSLCRKIAEDHQGSLEYLESDHGAHFRMSLPAIEVSSYTANDEILSKINDVRGKKVLVVDNDTTILNLCHMFLENSPYIFIGSTGGEEALEVMERFEADVVLTDLNMPKLNGQNFVKALRDKGHHIPVFYVSSEKGMEDYQRDKDDLKLSGMLVKPFKREQFLELLDKTFSQGEEG